MLLNVLAFRPSPVSLTSPLFPQPRSRVTNAAAFALPLAGNLPNSLERDRRPHLAPPICDSSASLLPLEYKGNTRPEKRHSCNLLSLIACYIDHLSLYRFGPFFSAHSSIEAYASDSKDDIISLSRSHRVLELFDLRSTETWVDIKLASATLNVPKGEIDSQHR